MTYQHCMQSVEDLVNEIATLELEVVHLEQHLLSLYRTAFDRYSVSSPSATYQGFRPHVRYHSGDPIQDSKVEIAQQHSQPINSDQLDEKTFPRRHSLSRSKESNFNSKQSGQSPACELPAGSDYKSVCSFALDLLHSYQLIDYLKTTNIFASHFAFPVTAKLLKHENCLVQ